MTTLVHPIPLNNNNSSIGDMNDDDMVDTLIALQNEGMLDDYLKTLQSLPNKTDFNIVNKKIQDITRKSASMEYLYQKADEEIIAMQYSKCSLHLPIKVGGKQLDALVDTGAEVNVISRKLVNELKLQDFVNTNVRGEIKGVGSSKVNGSIPYLEIEIDGAHCAACFTVLDTQTKDIIIGLPFIIFYEMDLDFKNKLISFGGKKTKMLLKDH